MPCRSFWFDYFWDKPVGSGRRFAWNFRRSPSFWYGLADDVRFGPLGRDLELPRWTLSGPIHLGEGVDQKRTENPIPVKKSSGRPLKPKPARRSICVFGVGWYSRPPSMKFVGRLSAAFVNVKMYHS